jgi:hypothetical protein
MRLVRPDWWVVLDRFAKRTRPVIEGHAKRARTFVDEKILSDPKRRMTAIAGVVAVVLMIIAIIAVATSGDGEDAAMMQIMEGLPSVDLVKSARDKTSAGDFNGAIQELEHAVFEENRHGDPAIHSALAHALVRAGRGGDAIQHYEIVLKKDPSALQESDVKELVSLLALPKEKGDRAVDLVVALGDRAAPVLTSLSADENADKLMRTRAKKALKSMKSGT